MKVTFTYYKQMCMLLYGLVYLTVDHLPGKLLKVNHKK